MLFKLEKQQPEIWEQLNNPDAGKGLCKEKKSKKSEITMEVGGSHSEFVIFLENRPKIALNQYDILE